MSRRNKDYPVPTAPTQSQPLLSLTRVTFIINDEPNLYTSSPRIYSLY